MDFSLFGKQFSFDFEGSLILLRFHRRGLKEESLDSGVARCATPNNTVMRAECGHWRGGVPLCRVRSNVPRGVEFQVVGERVMSVLRLRRASRQSNAASDGRALSDRLMRCAVKTVVI